MPRARRRSLRTSEARRWTIAAALATVAATSVVLTFVVGGGSGNAPPPPRDATLSVAGGAPSGSPRSGSAAARLGASAGRSARATTGRGIEAERIVIRRLGIDLPIVEGDGVDAPLHKAAHYPGTAWPGAGSNIYIYAHAQRGMFLDLWNVRIGDEVVLELVDGSERVYRVTEIRPRTRWDDLSVLQPTPHEQLTLQTSTSYTATAPRFVVIALPRS